MPGLTKFIIGCFILSAVVCVNVHAQRRRLRHSRRLTRWDEAENNNNVGDSYWANRWLNNLDEAENNHNVGDSYWANRWLNNLDESEENHNVGAVDWNLVRRL